MISVRPCQPSHVPGVLNVIRSVRRKYSLYFKLHGALVPSLISRIFHLISSDNMFSPYFYHTHTHTHPIWFSLHTNFRRWKIYKSIGVFFTLAKSSRFQIYRIYSLVIIVRNTKMYRLICSQSVTRHDFLLRFSYVNCVVITY